MHNLNLIHLSGLLVLHVHDHLKVRLAFLFRLLEFDLHLLAQVLLRLRLHLLQYVLLLDLISFVGKVSDFGHLRFQLPHLVNLSLLLNEELIFLV